MKTKKIDSNVHKQYNTKGVRRRSYSERWWYVLVFSLSGRTSLER